MKKLVFSVAFMLIGTFAFANNHENGDDKKKNETPKTEVVSETSNQTETEEEALRCKVSVSDGISTVTMSCWFCNCQDLLIDAQLALEDIQW